MRIRVFDTEAEAMAYFRKLVVYGTYKHVSVKYEEDWNAYVVVARG